MGLKMGTVRLEKYNNNWKEELAEKFKDNRKMYTASKHEFIQKILEKAKQ